MTEGVVFFLTSFAMAACAIMVVMLFVGAFVWAMESDRVVLALLILLFGIAFAIATFSTLVHKGVVTDRPPAEATGQR